MGKQELIKSLMFKFIDAMDKGIIECSEDEMDNAIESIGSIMQDKTPLSRYSAAKMLHLSLPTFDRKVANGDLPQGRKVEGFKELIWYKGDFLPNKK